MRTSLFFILLLSMVCVHAFATDLPSKSFRVVTSTNNKMEIEFTLPSYNVETTMEDGIEYQRILTDKGDYLFQTGLPELPIYSTFVALPYRGKAKVTIISTEKQEIAAFKPYPSQSKLENGLVPKQFVIDRSFYSSTSDYPQQIISTSSPQIIRDFRVMNVTMQPFSYNAGSGILTVQKKVLLRVDLEEGIGENEIDPPQSYSRSFEPLYRALIVNYDQVRDVSLPYQPERILMIRPNTTDQSYVNKFNEFVLWKKQKGYDVTAITTAVTGSTTTSVKAYIQNQYNTTSTRPDYVILVGDVGSIQAWTHTWNYYNGETDYPYTHLAGDDLLGDVFIGRISVESTTDFLNVISKVFTYEKIIPVQPATWLNRMLLVGDTSSSGISTIYTNKFIKDLSYSHNPNYTYNEVYGGSFPSLINAGINQGVGFWNYRGYIGMSQWSPGSSLVNGTKLPHAVIITCATGSFGGTSTTESLIRLGTANNPAGSVTAIGMSTSGTHTALNNCLTGSIFEGLFTHDMHTMGQALLYAKLYLNSIYAESDPTLCVAFAHICNLMGDPTVEVFKGVPSQMNLLYPASIANGSNMVEITVNDLIGHHIANANVTLSQDSVILYNGISDEDGKLYASIPSDLTGQIILTASKQDHYASVATIGISTEGSLICDSQLVDDDNTGNSNGNSNGQANGGETIELSINLKNTSSSTISDIIGTLTTTEPHIQISGATSTYSSITPGSVNVGNQPFVLSIDANCPDRTIAHLFLQLTNGVILPILMEVRNADMDISSTYVNDNGNHVLDPGETSIFNITLSNNGLIPLSGLVGVLHSTNDLVSVQDTVAVFGDIEPGGTVTCSTDAFSLHGQLQLVRGMKISFTLDISNSFGYSETETFSLNIGQVTVGDPLGPDNYGYLIYDAGDIGYPDAPIYSWVGISPAESGNGTLLPLNDVGSYGEGDAVGSTSILPVNLPFSFSFYGEIYQSVSICSNGFITFINSQNGDFRNWHLPGALGPNAMIAAFWDDLFLPTGSGVYTYFDAAQHRFIIEWYLARNGYNDTSEETFEIILYDPTFYPTSTGDGQIKIQYKVFNNVDIGGAPQQGNYSTIGIKDHTGLRGLEYTFNNHYPTAASPLSNSKALLITGIPVLLQAPHLLLGELIVMDTDNNQIAEPGETIDLGIRLSNMGLTPAQNVSASISSTDPYVIIINETSAYDPIMGQSTGINKNYFHIQISPNCPDGHVITFSVNITAQGYTWQRFTTLRVTKPALTFESTYINDMSGNNNGQANPGESFKVIMNVSNPGIVDVENVIVNVSTSSTSLSILTPSVALQNIPAGKLGQVVLDITLSENAQIGTYLPVQYTITSSNTNPVTNLFSIGVSTTGLFVNFETNSGNFISAGGWMWGTSGATMGHSGRNMWGTSLNTEYPSGADFVLKSPAMMVGSNAQLKFWHKYDCELSYDGGNVTISTDGGNSFNLLTPVGNYPVQSVYSLNEPCYNGNMMTWTQVIMDLSAYANQQIILRWHFCSDSIINGQGWFIDDVEISGFITPTGIIEGELQFPATIPDLQKTSIHVGNFNTTPDSNGNYRFYLPTGSYSVGVDMPSYVSQSGPTVVLNESNPTQTINFEMNYLPLVSHLFYQVSNHHLSMTWNPPETSQNQIIHYNILRRIDADRFQLVTETVSTNYTEDMQIVGQYSYYITVDYQNGVSTPSDTISFHSDATDNSDVTIAPLKTVLFANYPNPFNPETHISFAISKPGMGRLAIYNVKGQLVKLLKDEYFVPGRYDVVWNGDDQNNNKVASGVYFYRLSTPSYISTRKALLLK